ncbi:hypothetical protein EJV47_14125 [Hymenobacter gummosus]|uniref:Uncharacterized protein n=1 Tax=Hymenobacter gummosus TaxID=1776032 RepID=A0A3S0QHP9_9BACT|nr:hypothetical protein [Hymenobacter gummosus]RTQ49274.1 hypothetical protein EJV47_14125 [Hymenobacter gummosus]
MSEDRRNAYRYLLYHFLLEIRLAPAARPSCELSAEQQAAYVDFAGAMAYQLHNLALAAAQDFAGFEEAAFWGQFGVMDHWQPGSGVAARYRRVFEQQLAGGG